MMSTRGTPVLVSCAALCALVAAGCANPAAPETLDAASLRDTLAGKWRGVMYFRQHEQQVELDLVVDNGSIRGVCALTKGDVCLKWTIRDAWYRGGDLTFIAETEHNGRKARILFQCRLQGDEFTGVAESLDLGAAVRMKKGG